MNEMGNESGKYGKQCKLMSYYPCHCLMTLAQKISTQPGKIPTERLNDNLVLRRVTREE